MGRDPVVREDRVGGVDPLTVVEHDHPDPLATQGSRDHGHLYLGLGGNRLALRNVGNARRLEGVVGGGLRVRLEGGGSNHHHRRRGLGCGMHRRRGARALTTQVAIDERLARSLHDDGGGENAEPAKCHVMNVNAEWWRDPRHVRPSLIDLNANGHRGEDKPEGGAESKLQDDDDREERDESNQKLVWDPRAEDEPSVKLQKRNEPNGLFSDYGSLVVVTEADHRGDWTNVGAGVDQGHHCEPDLLGAPASLCRRIAHEQGHHEKDECDWHEQYPHWN